MLWWLAAPTEELRERTQGRRLSSRQHTRRALEDGSSEGHLIEREASDRESLYNNAGTQERDEEMCGERERQVSTPHERDGVCVCGDRERGTYTRRGEQAKKAPSRAPLLPSLPRNGARGLLPSRSLLEIFTMRQGYLGRGEDIGGCGSSVRFTRYTLIRDVQAHAFGALVQDIHTRHLSLHLSTSLEIGEKRGGRRGAGALTWLHKRRAVRRWGLLLLRRPCCSRASW